MLTCMQYIIVFMLTDSTTVNDTKLCEKIIKEINGYLFKHWSINSNISRDKIDRQKQNIPDSLNQVHEVEYLPVMDTWPTLFCF